MTQHGRVFEAVLTEQSLTAAFSLRLQELQDSMGDPNRLKLFARAFIEEFEKSYVPLSTPSAIWKSRGESDPHGEMYACESRASLAKGFLSDDELANACYVCDHRTSLESIGYLTAVKERIRWLSRRADRLEDENARLKEQVQQLQQRLQLETQGKEFK